MAGVHGSRTHLSVDDGHTGFEDRETHRGLSTPADSLVPGACRGQVRRVLALLDDRVLLRDPDRRLRDVDEALLVFQELAPCLAPLRRRGPRRQVYGVVEP